MHGRNEDAADSVARPGVGELRQQAGELHPLGVAERREGVANGIPSSPLESGHEALPLGGETHAGAACVVRVGFPRHQAELDRLLDEA